MIARPSCLPGLERCTFRWARASFADYRGSGALCVALLWGGFPEKSIYRFLYVNQEGCRSCLQSHGVYLQGQLGLQQSVRPLLSYSTWYFPMSITPFCSLVLVYRHTQISERRGVQFFYGRFPYGLRCPTLLRSWFDKPSQGKFPRVIEHMFLVE